MLWFHACEHTHFCSEILPDSFGMKDEHFTNTCYTSTKVSKNKVNKSFEILHIKPSQTSPATKANLTLLPRSGTGLALQKVTASEGQGQFFHSQDPGIHLSHLPSVARDEGGEESISLWSMPLHSRQQSGVAHTLGLAHLHPHR